jgi:uncharacterized membrane protein (UPF0127 family)
MTRDATRTVSALFVQLVGFALLGLSVLCSACAQSGIKGVFVDSASGAPTKEFSMEVCASDSERARGLMFRKSLEDLKGMIFIFPEEREHSFWMKNTYIPLDMLFIAKDLTVVGILENVPPLTETLRTVGKPSMYVVELAGGVTRKFGIKVGDRLRVEGSLPPPRD